MISAIGLPQKRSGIELLDLHIHFVTLKRLTATVNSPLTSCFPLSWTTVRHRNAKG